MFEVAVNGERHKIEKGHSIGLYIHGERITAKEEHGKILLIGTGKGSLAVTADSSMSLLLGFVHDQRGPDGRART